MSLVAVGYADQLQPISPAKLDATANQVNYHRGSLTEWYINDERGLEQGFTLDMPPPSANNNQLTLQLEIAGDLQTGVNYGRTKHHPLRQHRSRNRSLR